MHTQPGVHHLKHTSDRIRLVQLSDPHLGADRNYIQAGINTYKSLEQAVCQVVAENPVLDLVVATGDISCDAHAQSYRLFAQLLGDKRVPYAWLPGNHDDIDVMQRNLKAVPFRSRIDIGDWTLILLKTGVYNQVYGELSQQELRDLAYYLEEASGRHVVIFTHHPATKIGSRWIDKQRIVNADQLAEVAASYGNVKAIFSGHVHQVFHGHWQGIDVYTSPSTCFQFASGSKDFSITEEPPGYRWLDLFKNGRLETGVASVAMADQTADKYCMGY